MIANEGRAASARAFAGILVVVVHFLVACTKQHIPLALASFKLIFTVTGTQGHRAIGVVVAGRPEPHGPQGCSSASQVQPSYCVSETLQETTRAPGSAAARLCCVRQAPAAEPSRAPPSLTPSALPLPHRHAARHSQH